MCAPVHPRKPAAQVKPVLRSVLFSLLTACAAGSLAADGNGKFAMKGAGFLPCKVLSTEREKRSDVYFLIAGWVEGFVTAYNRSAADTFDITSFESTELLLSVMHNHCKDHPADPLYPVLNSMLAQLHPGRLVKESERIEVSAGERRTLLYLETIRRMQAELQRRGLYKGDVDGRYSEATSAALKAFQSDAALDNTGFPDQTTLWRLLRK